MSEQQKYNEEHFDVSTSPDSGRRSGMYQAVPVFIEEPETVEQKCKVKPEAKFVATQPTIKSETTEKHSLERREFLESMLKSSTSVTTTSDHQIDFELEESRCQFHQQLTSNFCLLIQ